MIEDGGLRMRRGNENCKLQIENLKLEIIGDRRLKIGGSKIGIVVSGLSICDSQF